MYSIFLVNIILGEIALILFVYIWNYISEVVKESKIKHKSFAEQLQERRDEAVEIKIGYKDFIKQSDDSGVIPYKTNKQAKEEKEKQKGPELEDLLP